MTYAPADRLARTLTALLLLVCAAGITLLAQRPAAPSLNSTLLTPDQATGLLVVDARVLRAAGQDRGLLLHDDLDTARHVCLEMGTTRTGRKIQCVTVGQLAAWVRAGAPTPR